MNVRFKRRLSTVFACGTVIAVAFLVACEIPVQPQPREITPPEVVQREQLAAPTFQPSAADPAGEALPVFTTDSVAINHPLAEARIYYTRDGSDPAPPTAPVTEASPPTMAYNEPLNFASLAGELQVSDAPRIIIIKAIAVAASLDNSEIVTGNFWVLPPAGMPTFMPESEEAVNRNGQLNININNPADATIHYSAGVDSEESPLPDPSVSSGEPYNEPLTFAGILPDGGELTVKAIAFKEGVRSPSAIASATYTVPLPQLLAPTFGTENGQTVARNAEFTLGNPNPGGASIRYTTDGSNPSNSTGSLYNSEEEKTFAELLPEGGPLTITAIAFMDGTHLSSTVATATYIVSLREPIFSPASGETVSHGTELTLNAASDITIRYSAGVESEGAPLAAPATISDANAYNALLKPTFGDLLRAGGELTVKAVAFKTVTMDGRTITVSSAVATATYTVPLRAEAPSFHPPSTIIRIGELELRSATSGATIYYTWGVADVPDPSDTSGSEYKSAEKPTFGGLSPDGGTLTVKAIAFMDGTHLSSTVATATYIVPLREPTFSPASGETVSHGAELTLNAASDITIRYSAGVESEGAPLAAPATISDANAYNSLLKPTFGDLLRAGGELTVKAVAFKTVTVDGRAITVSSAVATATYTVPLPREATPSVSPDTGTVAHTAMLTISGGTTGADIRYTVGVDSEESPLAAPASVSDGNGYTSGTPVALNSLGDGDFPRTFTVKVVAFKDETHQPSATVTRRYTVSLPRAEAPSFHPPSTITRIGELELRSATSGATIHYTWGVADVPDPSDTSGTEYKSAEKPTFGRLSPDGGTLTVKAIAFMAGTHLSSTVATATYTVPLHPAMQPTFSGTTNVLDTDSLTIQSSTDRASIRYTAGAGDVVDPTDSRGTLYKSAEKPTFGSLVASQTTPYPRSVTVKAIAFKAGSYAASTVASRTFTVAYDVDADDDGLIEIRNLDMLDNIRHNLAGRTYDDDAADLDDPTTIERTEDAGSSTGASTTEPANCNDNDADTTITLCGYELAQDLDFANGAHYALGVVKSAWRPTEDDPDTARNVGFIGFGAATGTTGGFTAIFEGNGHSIKNLYSRNTSTSTGNYVGLFRLLGSGAVIRNVGVTDADVYGGGDHDYVGGLVGFNYLGRITASYASGNADGGDGGEDRVGGLVGVNRGTIIASYAAGNADGGDGNDRVGGLVGNNGASGTITASYAIGNADGGDGNSDSVGGLVGNNNGGTITASYATGNADGENGASDQVGGLVGYNSGTITASYAIGNADGGDGNSDSVGGLVGVNNVAIGGAITASYAFGTATGETAGHDGSNKPSAVLVPHDLKGSSGDATTYAGASWNNAGDSTLGAWNFGNNSQLPALVYADYDGSGNVHSCDNYPDEIPGTTITLRCGIANPSLVGNYRPAMVEIPIFSLAAGNILTSQALTISTPTTGATVYYSTDGSIPVTTGVSRSPSGIAGSSSVTLDLDTFGTEMKNIRAVAVKADYLNSVEASRTFTVTYDVDADNNGLIEIRNLDMLDNIRHNLAGTDYKTSGSDAGNSTGAPTTTPSNCAGRTPPTTLCGYELAQSLDFSIQAHYASGSTNMTAWRPNNTNPDRATNEGFPGLGTFTGIFDGNGHTIKKLYSRGTGNVGLFRLLGSDGVIRNVGVTEANVYGGSGAEAVGGLVGRNFRGTITASYATGTADGGAGYNDYVGGLVGYNYQGTITASYANGRTRGGNVGGLVGYNYQGTITASYATGSADGGDGSNDSVGGLVGRNFRGTITASYATGNAYGGDGSNDSVGGLVGDNDYGTIIASYATGTANGGGRNVYTFRTDSSNTVGGLVGWNSGTITASYATGNADGGGRNRYFFDRREYYNSVGGLVGSNGGTITASYAFGTATGEIAGHNGSSKPSAVREPHNLKGSSGDTTTYAGASWNSTGDNTLGAWNFGTGSQVPALVYADYDGTGNAHSCDNYPDEIPGTTITLRCGIANPSLVGNYRPAIVQIPTFSLAAGNVLTRQALTISTPTTGATIYYTTDGSIPITTGASRSPSGNAGSSSVTLSLRTVGTGMKNIRAVAVKVDYLNSLVVSRAFTITNADYIIVTAADPASISESGGSAEYMVSLSSVPTSTVTVTVGGLNSKVTATGPALTNVLTFEPGGSGNWGLEQIVTITTVDNSVFDGTDTFTLTHTAASADTNYNNFIGPEVTVTVTDDETSGITFSATAITVTEEGTEVMYTVSLTNRPATGTAVVIKPAPSNNAITVSPHRLWFTGAPNWSESLPVTVSARNDADNVDNDFTITHTLVSPSPGATPDPAYYRPTFSHSQRSSDRFRQ